MASSTKKGAGHGTDEAPKATKPDQPDLTAHNTNDAEPTPWVRPPAPPEPELHIHQLFGILRRRSRLIAMMALVGAMLATVVAVLIPPKFTAKASVVVEPARSASGTDLGSAIVDATAIDTQMTMLTTRDHLRAVLASLKEDPAFADPSTKKETGADADASETDKEPGEAGSVFDKIGKTTSDLIEGAKASIYPREPLPEFDKFERTLNIDQERRSRVVTVRYTSTNPEQAAVIVNRVIELFIRNQAEIRRASAENELTRLGTQITELEGKLATIEKTIRQRLTASPSDPLAEQGDGVTLRQLEREASENAQRYVTLLQRQKQVIRQQGAPQASVGVLSYATPPKKPSTADPKLFILPALLLSLIGGGILAVILERFNRALRSERQIQNVLGLPCIGQVPRLRWTFRTRPHQHLLKKPFSPYTEAIRSIAASLQFMSPEQTSQVVLVSSSLQGEGKTTLATSLAIYAARLQRRVLLVDLDFRHPAVKRELGLAPDSGVLDLVASEESLDDVVQRLPELGLDFLPMHRCPVDPVTLFANGEMQNILDEVKKNYDFIIIDGPPMLGVTETGLLASLVDKVLFSVRWNSTRRDVALNALNELQALGWSGRDIAKRVRAVVTQVDLKQHARYQFGDAAELYVTHRKYYNHSGDMASHSDRSKSAKAIEERTAPSLKAAE